MHRLNHDELKQSLYYNPTTGEFYWLKRIMRDIVRTGRAGTKDKNGYRYISYKGKRYAEHRLAWFYVYNEIPNVIDHINHITDDNRIENLRNVSIKENSRNQKLRVDSTIGEQGIWYNPKLDKYVVNIRYNGKRIHQRSFTNIDEAISFRKTKLIELGFHENHGVKL